MSDIDNLTYDKCGKCGETKEIVCLVDDVPYCFSRGDGMRKKGGEDMSGLYIPNMNYPKVGEVICVFPNGKVQKRIVELSTLCEVVETSEAIPVPDHGRLVDADDAIGHLFNGEQCLYSWDEIEEAIDATETVIPAEEG